MTLVDGFVPESMDDELPIQLARDTTSKSITEESYIAKAESTVSHTHPIYFEGSMNKSTLQQSPVPSASSNHEYVLTFDPVAKEFKVQKFSGIIRMSKSRNESTLSTRLSKLVNSTEKDQEYQASLAQIYRKRQASISRVRKNIIPQDIPLPKKLKKLPSVSAKSRKKLPSGKRPIEDGSLDDMIDKEMEFEDKPKVVQPQPISKVAKKRLPISSSGATTPISSQPAPEDIKNGNDAEDSDFGSLEFELEAELDNGKRVPVAQQDEGKESDNDEWRINNMDWDMDDGDFEMPDGEDDDTAFNIVIEEPKSSQEAPSKNAKSAKELEIKRELTPNTGPISMKELASLRAGGAGAANARPGLGSSPLMAPTPVMTSSSRYPSSSIFKKQGSSTPPITSVPTPKLADDPFGRVKPRPAVSTTNYEEDEDISEEE